MKKSFATFGKTYTIFKPFLRHFTVAVLLLTIVEVLSLLYPYFFGKLINALQMNVAIRDALILVSVAFSVSLADILVRQLKDRYEIHFIDYSVQNSLTQRTLSKILSLSIGQHRGQNSGLTQSVINKGQSSLINIVNLALYEISTIFVRVVATITALMWFNRIAGAVVLTGIIIQIVWSHFMTNKFREPIETLQDMGHKNGKAHSEILRNTSLIQVNSQEARMENEYTKRLDDYGEKGKSTWLSYLWYALTRSLVTAFTQCAVLITGVVLVLHKEFLFGDFVILMFWTNKATGDLNAISRIHREWLDLSTSVRKYFAILDIPPAVTIVPNPIRPKQFEGTIEFENVSFTYPQIRYIEIDEKNEAANEATALSPALTAVSFKINAGEHVAFVGESGTGKSTIVNLLVRGYDPEGGRILVDGNDLRLLDLKEFREQIGLVEQSVSLFDNTLRYNVLFGLNGQSSNVTDEELERLAHVSCIDRFYHRLTNKWDTWIGENGVRLSGGERQRVGIARALVKDPRILVLDEATSSLDAVNEMLIKKAVQNASIGRTTIIIAHRLSTVRDVDRIFVMDKGQIIAEGKHEMLLESSERYRELVENQLFTG